MMARLRSLLEDFRGARRTSAPRTVEDFLCLADGAAAERRWIRALEFIRQARTLAPNDARVWADEGEYLFQVGLFDEALQAFATASRLDASEGYVDYRGAQAAAAAGRPADEVLAWLSRALERSPDLVGDLVLFREFENLHLMPAYVRMVRQAYERLGIDPEKGLGAGSEAPS